LTLINQVLDLSKIEAGKITLNEKDVDLYHLLSDLEDTFAVRAQAKDLQLRFERADSVPQYVRTDEVKLRQVLINLLNNAIKFTTEGEVTVQVETGRRPVSEETAHRPVSTMIHFEISDTGPGIAFDEMDTLFEAFAQTETGRQLQEGTGLGLSISQKFVQLMGGDIRVASQVGKGSTFTFSILVQLVDQAAFAAQHAARTKRPIALEPNQRAADGDPASSGLYRILIVDDHPYNRRMLVKLLSTLDPSPDSLSTDSGTGFDLREARNGQEAIDIWKEWRPHLIWMDLRMPGMDGYQAAERIREIEGQKGRRAEEQKNRGAENDSAALFGGEQSPARTVIIILSASSFEDEREIALTRGCDGFLRKPFHEAELFELMHTHLGVRFVYEEEQGAGNREQGAGNREQGAERKVITPEDLAALPEELRKNVHEAVDMLDTDRVYSLLGQIRQQNEPLAESLEELVKAYRFDLLQGLLKITS
jgi:signal transduction histidine kinase